MTKRSVKKYPNVRPHGKGIQCDITINRKRLRPTLPMPATSANLKLAQSIVGSILRDKALGNLNLANYFPGSKILKHFSARLPATATVADAIDWWFETGDVPKDPDTIEGYKRVHEHHIRNSTLGRMLLTEVKSIDVQDWRKKLRMSEKSQNNVVIPLRRAMNWAVEQEVIGHNPMAGIKNHKLPKREADPFLPVEIDKVLETMEAAVRYLFVFSVWTGLSPSERYGLQWQDVDLDAKVLHVRRAIVEGKLKSTKNTTRWRTVEMFQPAIDALIECKKLTGHQEWVFLNPRSGTLWGSTTLSRELKRQMDAAAVRYRSPYKSRHTFASIMLSAGVSLGWLRQQMGHEDFAMIQKVYGKWIDSSGPATQQTVREWVIEKVNGGHIPRNVAHLFQTGS